MSGYELGAKSITWSRKAPLRVIGYTTPVVTLIVFYLWFRPQNELGWVAVGAVVVLSFIVPFATLSQARSEIRARHVRQLGREQSLSIFEERPLPESGYAGPNGQMAMEDFLASQP